VNRPVPRQLQGVSHQEMEDQDRQGYLKHPQTEEELGGWEDIAAWPEWSDTI